MECPTELVFEEEEATVNQEGFIDMNTNASSKVRRETKRPGSRNTGGGAATAERKEESLDGEETVGEGDGGLDKNALETESKTSGVSSSLKPKNSPSRISGSQDRTAKNDMRRVKNINIGEIPLCPVGLSLSGSGMQLYVKMDSFLHKKQLACLKNQFVSKISKASAVYRKMGKRKKTSSQHSSTAHHPPLNGDGSGSAQPEHTDPHMATIDSQPKDVVHPSTSSNAEIPVIDLTTDSRHSTADDPQSCCDILIKQEVLSDESEGGEMAEDDYTFHPSQRKSSILKHSSTSHNYGSDRIPSNLSHKYQLEPDKNKSNKKKGITSGNKRRDSKRNQAIQTNLAVGRTLAKPKPTITQGIGSQKRPMPPPVFTSSDLPLKRPSLVRSCSSADVLIHQQRNNSSFFFPVKPERAYVYRPKNTNNASATLPPEPNVETNVSSRNTTLADQEEKDAGKVNKSESSKYALIETPGPGSLPLFKHPCTPHASTTHDPHGASLHLTYDPVSDRQVEQSETSLPDFDPTQALAAGVVDAETLAKFAEYTSSMRRDLRQNYKRLSGLMKDFNEQVLEHSRNQTDLTTGNLIDSDPEDDTFSTDGRSRCLLM